MSISSTRPELSIDRLRDAVNGSVIGPDDADYDAQRTVMYGGIDPTAGGHRPRRRCEPTSPPSIDVARETGLELAVRSGGHSGAGHSTTDGGIVLDLRDLKAIDIDLDRADGLGRSRA